MKAISPVLPSSPRMPELVYGKDQPEYLPLPAVKVGYQTKPGATPTTAVITRYRLSPEELAEVQRTGCVWLEVFTIYPEAPLPPQRLTVFEPLTKADQIQGHEAKSGLVHYAGPYVAGVQRCISCGGILLDHRQMDVIVASEGKHLKNGFPEGPVTIIGNMRGAFADASLPSCLDPEVEKGAER